MNIRSRHIPIYFSTALFSLSYALILYLNSSYLLTYFTEGMVSFLYVLGAVGNIILFFTIPELTRRYGSGRLFLIFLTLEVIAIGSLVSSFNPLVIGIGFLLHSSIAFLVFYFLDVFLEDTTRESETGEVRGIYLTLLNSAIALAPLIFAWIIARDGGFNFVYVAALLLILPVIIVGYLSFRKFADGRVDHAESLPLSIWWHSKDLRRSTAVKFVLEVFFAIMIIYTPVYLSQVMHFSWGTIGIILFIILLPFVFLSWPVGELADKWCGEKELMTTGLFVMGGSLLVMPFLGPSVIAWIITLFASRIGASLVETTSDVYFFKHVDKRDVGLISIFRLTRATSIIFGSIIGAVSMTLFSFEKIFFIVSIIVFLGLRETLYLKDTR